LRGFVGVGTDGIVRVFVAFLDSDIDFEVDECGLEGGRAGVCLVLVVVDPLNFAVDAVGNDCGIADKPDEMPDIVGNFQEHPEAHKQTHCYKVNQGEAGHVLLDEAVDGAGEDQPEVEAGDGEGDLEDFLDEVAQHVYLGDLTLYALAKMECLLARCAETETLQHGLDVAVPGEIPHPALLRALPKQTHHGLGGERTDGAVGTGAEMVNQQFAYDCPLPIGFLSVLFLFIAIVLFFRIGMGEEVPVNDP
jgi:hypothetical protein